MNSAGSTGCLREQILAFAPARLGLSFFAHYVYMTPRIAGQGLSEVMSCYLRLLFS